MLCKICGAAFMPRHFNQRCCSSRCKKVARRAVLRRYKKSQKGIEAEARWRLSPQKKQIDSRYRQTARARKLAVARAKRQLSTNDYARSARKRTDRLYLSRTQGRLRRWWKDASAGGCRRCGTSENLGLDHIVPKRLGGSDDPSNLQVLCRACNGKKGARLEGAL